MSCLTSPVFTKPVIFVCLILSAGLISRSRGSNRPLIQHVPGKISTQNNALFEQVSDIPLPPGFYRLPADTGSFAYWLRKIPLKTDPTVYLFDGTKKLNQSAQFAVLDISIGAKDLQQCADAVMRLRAEYLLSVGRVSEIRFFDNAGKKYSCPPAPSRQQFLKYLEKVYASCGTISLGKQMQKVNGLNKIEPGQVFIKGGSPGHAVIVTDVAVNNRGERIFTLAQSYMPAQSVHILKNPVDGRLSPWYAATQKSASLQTPEWLFRTDQLKGW